ncbi:11248_t:CDS:1, partial [Racocetra fulgida]
MNEGDTLMSLLETSKNETSEDKTLLETSEDEMSLETSEDKNVPSLAQLTMASSSNILKDTMSCEVTLNTPQQFLTSSSFLENTTPYKITPNTFQRSPTLSDTNIITS